MRDYDESRYEFGDHSITLTGSEVTLEEEDIPTFLGIRQSEFETELLVTLKTDAKEAGITCTWTRASITMWQSSGKKMM
mgnify:CR=1 FL=1